MIYEVCIESMQGLAVAGAVGAARVELCSNLSLGGTTPSAGLIQAALGSPHGSALEVIVLLRPRAGDFVYSEEEFDLLRRDLSFAKREGAAGVALGLLTPAGDLDLERCRQLVELARPMQVCFHRAFDFAREPFEVLEQLIELGVQRILTSGGQADVREGLESLTELVQLAGERIEIMPGGGVRADHVRELLRTTGARSVHFSASEFAPSSSRWRNPSCSLQASSRPTEFELQRTSEAQARAIIDAAEA